MLPKNIVYQLRTTIGGSDSNSYLEVEEAAEYFSADVHFFQKWQSMTEEEQTSWLRLSTRTLDRFENYLGTRQYNFQALEFPRIPVRDVIPQVIKDAQAELCMFLVNNKTTAEALDTREVSNMSVLNGLLKMDYSGKKDLEAERTGGGAISTVKQMLAEWLEPIRWARG